jgi:hypothetical protein
MNRIQISKRTMLGGLIDYLDFRSVVYAGDNPFKASVLKLKNVVVKIEAEDLRQQKQSQGVTAEKKSLHDIAISRGFFIANQIAYYATQNDKKDLLAQVKFPLSYFEDMAGAKLVTFLRTIEELATNQLSHLGDYDITQQLITDFGTAIDNFDIYLGRPRGVIASVETATDNLPALFKEAMDLLDNELNRGILKYKAIDLEFYQMYFLRRELIGPGFHKFMLRINVVDKETLDPMQLVDITVKEYNIHHKTSKLGNSNFRTMPDGTITLVLKTPGYKEITKKVAVKDGLTKFLTFQMEQEVL